ncbi:protein PAXX isoform X1 [Haemorhous mexicanus]|uniref:protein PAXX isoform X1 n=1 Tax=Haemorhous mexicanus TaxID=30427 RepID=UPI0028BD75CC|nr:protein PAXX isoform X1 [Haemorhous mexicanus]
MAEPAGPFHVLRSGTGRFLCYCGPDGVVYVTDAMEVWAGELGGCPALGSRCPPAEHGAMLRAALGHGAAALSLGPAPAALRLPEEPQCPAVALAQLPTAEARSQLQALVFGMAGRIESLEKRLEVAVETLASSCSPEKSTAQSQHFLPDLLSSSTQEDNRGSSTWQPPLSFPLWGEQMEQRGHQHGAFFPCSSSWWQGPAPDLTYLELVEFGWSFDTVEWEDHLCFSSCQ